MGQEISRIFNIHGLKITIKVNHKIVHYLDVTFDLDSQVYKPYRKENDTPIYVDKNSNHPPSVLKN